MNRGECGEFAWWVRNRSLVNKGCGRKSCGKSQLGAVGGIGARGDATLYAQKGQEILLKDL